MTILPHDQIFEMIGGKDKFRQITDTFYDKIKNDEILRSMFPEDLEPGKQKQFLFLIQKFGGPRDYETLRGHARLRRRHLKFNISVKERNQWIKLMKLTLDEVGITNKHPARETLDEYFERVGTKMINQKSGFNIL